MDENAYSTINQKENRSFEKFYSRIFFDNVFKKLLFLEMEKKPGMGKEGDGPAKFSYRTQKRRDRFRDCPGKPPIAWKKSLHSRDLIKKPKWPPYFRYSLS